MFRKILATQNSCEPEQYTQMRKLLFILCVLLFLVSLVFSQNSTNNFGIIKGTVTTSDDKPAALVTVRELKDTKDNEK